MQGIGNVVSKSAFCLGIMGEAGLEHLIAYLMPIGIKHIDTQTRGHPTGGLQSLLVDECGHKPVGTVGRTTTVFDRLFDYRGAGR